jgi:hypothetical protein
MGLPEVRTADAIPDAVVVVKKPSRWAQAARA